MVDSIAICDWQGYRGKRKERKSNRKKDWSDRIECRTAQEIPWPAPPIGYDWGEADGKHNLETKLALNQYTKTAQKTSVEQLSNSLPLTQPPKINRPTRISAESYVNKKLTMVQPVHKVYNTIISHHSPNFNVQTSFTWRAVRYYYHRPVETSWETPFVFSTIWRHLLTLFLLCSFIFSPPPTTRLAFQVGLASGRRDSGANSERRNSSLH